MVCKLVIFGAVAVLAAQALPQRSGQSSTTTTTTTKAPTPKPDYGLNITFVLQGSNLPTKDDHSEVDAFVKVYNVGINGKEDERIGTTDVIQDNANPEWNNVFSTFWKRGTGQKWKFVVRDNDLLNKDDDVGEVVVDLDKFVDQNRNYNVSLSEGGQLTIKATQPIKFQLYARNLPHKDRFDGKSDGYVEAFWRKGKDGTDIPMGTTAVIDNEDNPDWKETFEFANYIKGTDQWWYFKVYDSDSLSSSDTIGDLLVEVDSFASKRATKTSKLSNSDNKATLSITPL